MDGDDGDDDWNGRETPQVDQHLIQQNDEDGDEEEEEKGKKRGKRDDSTLESAKDVIDVLGGLSFMSMTASDFSNLELDMNVQKINMIKEVKDRAEADSATDIHNPALVPPDDGLTILDILPWEDILVSRVFSYLDLRDLFQLRQVCPAFRDIVSIHFAQNHHLDLSHVGSEFTPDAFRVVTADAKNLTTLNVACCKKWITDDLLRPVVESNRNLREVNISGNSGLSTQVVRIISVMCPDLTSLSLAECQQVTSTSVESVGMNCEQLEHLDLTGCWAMDDETISLVLQMHPQLRWLSVARAYGITDLLVDEICRFCPNIEYLDIQGCWRITDAAVRQLWNLTHLKTLKVKDCRYITERSLARFRAKGVQLDVLLPEESDLAKLERHLRAREFARARSIPPNFVI